MGNGLIVILWQRLMIKKIEIKKARGQFIIPKTSEPSEPSEPSNQPRKHHIMSIQKFDKVGIIAGVGVFAIGAIVRRHCHYTNTKADTARDLPVTNLYDLCHRASKEADAAAAAAERKKEAAAVAVTIADATSENCAYLNACLEECTEFQKRLKKGQEEYCIRTECADKRAQNDLNVATANRQASVAAANEKYTAEIRKLIETRDAKIAFAMVLEQIVTMDVTRQHEADVTVAKETKNVYRQPTLEDIKQSSFCFIDDADTVFFKNTDDSLLPMCVE